MSYGVKFPDNRSFYFFDKFENIRGFKPTNMNDPNYIYVLYQDENKQVHERAYKRDDFLGNYEFGKIILQNVNNKKYINFIIPKEKFNKNMRTTILLTELKTKLPVMEDIKKNYEINIIDNDCVFVEHQMVPLEDKFYNRIFTLQIQKPNQIKQNYQKKNSNQNLRGNMNVNIINNNNNVNNPINNRNQFLPQNVSNNQQQNYLGSNQNYNNFPNNNINNNYNNVIYTKPNQAFNNLNNNNPNNAYNNNYANQNLNPGQNNFNNNQIQNNQYNNIMNNNCSNQTNNYQNRPPAPPPCSCV